MEINKVTLPKFRNEFAAAVKELEAKHNIKIELGSISFSDISFTTKLKVTNTVSSSGEKIDGKVLWKKECRQIGLSEEDYGASVTVNGMHGILVGLKLRSFKYPIIVEAADGRRYKMSVGQVKSRIIKA